jgi:hypothetical protein
MGAVKALVTGGAGFDRVHVVLGQPVEKHFEPPRPGSS